MKLENHRNSRRLRLGPDDQGGGRADLPDGRVLVRQCRARRALFNLEVPGYRYSRISNPTSDILERRVTELEGGVESLSVSSGQTALYYAALNVTEMGRNIISVPQLYGTTYTLFAHILPKMGVQVRFAKSDRAADIESLVDDDTRAIFCETVGNPAGKRVRPRSARRRRASPSHGRSSSTTRSRHRYWSARSITVRTSSSTH